MDTIVERDELRVLRIRADFAKGGPPEAFTLLEARLPTLKGRHFYGTFRLGPNGPVYYACVERIASDPPAEPPLTDGTVPGGRYARRRILDWSSKVPTFPAIAQEMIGRHGHDPRRPTVEYYRSRTELHFLVPVPDHPERRQTTGRGRT